MNKVIFYILLLASSPIFQTKSMDFLSSLLGNTTSDMHTILALEDRYRLIVASGRQPETLALLRRQAIADGEGLFPLIKAQKEMITTIGELKKISDRHAGVSDSVFSETLPALMYQLTTLAEFVSRSEDFEHERLVADENEERERMRTALERFAAQIGRIETSMTAHFSMLDAHLSDLDQRVNTLGYCVNDLTEQHATLARRTTDISDRLVALSNYVHTRTGDCSDGAKI